MNSLVSVLMPYKNASSTILEALDSLLAQESVELEIVAINDGSTDSGASCVARIAEHDRRVVMLSTTGVGIARALNAGLALTRGTYIARMDADDICSPTRFAAQLSLLRSNPRLGAVGVRVYGFPESAVGEGLKRYIEWQNELVTPEDHVRDLFVESPLCHPTVMMRRDCLEELRGWRELTWPEDYDLWLRLNAAGWLMAKVPEVLFGWRHDPSRASFTDPHYAPEEFRKAKAHFLARRLRAEDRPWMVWGAGPTGKRMARELESYGLIPEKFIDIDPRKIGRCARGIRIDGPESVWSSSGTMVVVAVGSLGARALIRSILLGHGMGEGRDFICVA